MALSTTRLRKEFKELQKNPLQNIRAAPKETNVLEWHYVIIGQEKTDYADGYYHGTVVFPSEYPYKPPTIRMMTPSGRFKPGARLCLSMSDFHPETWNPMWSVGTILMGLYSFMQDSDITNGSVESTKAEKVQFAKDSLEFNVQNKVYCELFPDLVELASERRKAALEYPVQAAESDVPQSPGAVLKPSSEEQGAENDRPAPLTAAAVLANAAHGMSGSVSTTRTGTPVAGLGTLATAGSDTQRDAGSTLSDGIASMNVADLPTPPVYHTTTVPALAGNVSSMKLEAEFVLSSVEPSTPPVEAAEDVSGCSEDVGLVR